MEFLRKIWNGPYSFIAYFGVVSVGASLITGVAVLAEGFLLYQGHAMIPAATHISETFFTGFLATMITGIILHRHASKNADCLTLRELGHCPFLGLLILGLVVGGISLGLMLLIQGSGDLSFEAMMKAKGIQGFLTGLILPLLYHRLKLLRHPGVRYA